MSRPGWDLSALLNAADPRAPRHQRHLWLVRLVEWLRHGPAQGQAGDTPMPVLRIRHLLNVLERNAEPRERVVALLGRFWRETDLASLFADFGFTARRDLWGEVGERLAVQWLPGTPDTDDLAALFQLIFTRDDDHAWFGAIDEATLARLVALMSAARGGAVPAPGEEPAADWRAPLLQAMTWLVSAIRAAAFAPALRCRMGAELLANQPFDQLAPAAQSLIDALRSGDPLAAAPHANYLRALLQRCHAAADSIYDHLEEFGVSVNIVFEVQQLQARAIRLEALVDLAMSATPQRELHRLLVDLVALARERRSVRALLARQYSLMARKVAERHAETGEHYITRTRDEYATMLRQAAGGGAVIAGTTFAKFFLLALGLAPFWSGVAAGMNYAISFLIVHLMHWTVATKQPAMTAPALAEKLAGLGVGARDDQRNAGRDIAAVEAFVDEVSHLVRSQIAGILGNIALVIPVVLVLQWLAWAQAGRPLVSEADARYVLHSITLLGPTALFAAFTGVLLFASSLVAGWVENWFVYHRIESALAYNPGIVARLGAPRALRWSAWWRGNISGVAANVTLGLMLGVAPVLLAFVGLHIEVRHVTLSSGQLAAAASTLGWETLREPAFWWCAAGLVVTAVLNLGVSFWLALKVALRSRRITLKDRRRLYGGVWRRLRRAPRSFLLPE
ncbi:MAG: site-specific recombinase [Burkholderiaceae bacterium]|nr:site-specific recombinase [Burkholderiaceae bacterium]